MTAVITAANQAAGKTWLARHWVSVLTLVVGSAVVVTAVTLLGYSLTWPGFARVVLVLFVARHVVAVGWWMNRRRRLLAKSSLPAPSAWRMLDDWRRERARVAYVTKQWSAACSCAWHPRPGQGGSVAAEVAVNGGG